MAIGEVRNGLKIGGGGKIVVFGGQLKWKIGNSDDCSVDLVENARIWWSFGREIHSGR